MTNYCDGTIKGIRQIFSNNLFNFQLPEKHSILCLHYDEDNNISYRQKNININEQTATNNYLDMENTLTLNSSFSNNKNNGLSTFSNNDNHNNKDKDNSKVKNTQKTNFNFFNELNKKFTSF